MNKCVIVIAPNVYPSESTGGSTAERCFEDNFKKSISNVPVYSRDPTDFLFCFFMPFSELKKVECKYGSRIWTSSKQGGIHRRQNNKKVRLTTSNYGLNPALVISGHRVEISNFFLGNHPYLNTPTRVVKLLILLRLWALRCKSRTFQTMIGP